MAVKYTFVTLIFCLLLSASNIPEYYEHVFHDTLSVSQAHLKYNWKKSENYGLGSGFVPPATGVSQAHTCVYTYWPWLDKSPYQ